MTYKQILNWKLPIVKLLQENNQRPLAEQYNWNTLQKFVDLLAFMQYVDFVHMQKAIEISKDVWILDLELDDALKKQDAMIEDWLDTHYTGTFDLLPMFDYEELVVKGSEIDYDTLIALQPIINGTPDNIL